MMRTHKTKVFLFDDLPSAHLAVDRLIRRGVKPTMLGLVTQDATGQAVGDDWSVGRIERVDPVQVRSFSERATRNGARGAIVGGLVGMLGGLGALTLPGAGTMLFLGSVTGAVAGGLMSALSTHFIHENEALVFEEAVRRGGTLLFVHDEAVGMRSLSSVMTEAGAVNLARRVSQWRAAGWTGHAPPAPPVVAAASLDGPFEEFFLDEEPGAEDPWVKKNWERLREPVLSVWPRLTFDDLREIDGHRGRLISRVCRLYDYSEEVAERRLDELLDAVLGAPDLAEPERDRSKTV